jgi:hypothetical protein
MTNILTEILLESELKGTIYNPAYYFSDAAEAETDADLLMLTHGWTRYDIPKAMRGEWVIPEIDYETSQVFSGMVKGGIIPRASSNIEVSVMSHQGKERYFDVTRTDENGFFRFENFELPDSSEIAVQVLKGNKRKKGLLEVITDTIEYPFAGDFSFPHYYLKTTNPFIEEMIAETDYRYAYINGIKVIQIPEVVIKPKRKKSQYDNLFNIEPDYFMAEEEIKASGMNDVLTLISKLPYVTVRFRGWQSTVEVQMLHATAVGRTSALIVINGIPFENISPISALSLIKVSDIAEIHLINTFVKSHAFLESSGDHLSLDALEPGNNFSSVDGDVRGIVEIITKDGLFYNRRQRFHFKSLMPLGYATPTEFYSPKYDTPKSLDDESLDMRTTIYWKPDIVVNKDNKTSVDFYTADTHTTYSVVTEGICSNGTLIYKHEKSIVKVEK